MKNYFYAAAAAFALTAVMTGCTGKKEPVVEVSTPDTSAKLTSENTSETFMAEKTTTSAIKIKITETSDSGNSEPVTTYTVSSEKKETDLSSDKPVVTSKAPRVTEYVEDPEETDVPVITQTAATTVTTAVTEQPTRPVTTRPVPAREDILSAYKEAVEMKIDSMNESGTESFSVSYTLFDMDGNGIPELIVKCGTGEDDYQDTFFTFDGFGIKVISDGTEGSHSSFSYDKTGNGFVSAYADMGSAVLEWLGYDGSDITVLKTAEFEYDSENPYEAQAAKYDVELLPFAMYTKSHEELTRVYRVVDSELEYDEISGLDFSFIDNFEME